MTRPVIFDFHGMVHVRPRERVRLAMYACACKLAGTRTLYAGAPAEAMTYLERFGVTPASADDFEDSIRWFAMEGFVTGHARSRNCWRRVILETNGKRPSWLAKLKAARWAAEVPGGGFYLGAGIDTKVRRMQPNVVTIPHTVGPKLIELFAEDGVLEWYLRDAIQAIRVKYAEPIRYVPGFRGAAEYSRQAKAAQMPWCSAEWTPLPPREYVREMMLRGGVVDFPGQLAVTFRFTEAVLFGRPVIRDASEAPELACPVTDRNAILLHGWGDKGRLEDGLRRSDEIVSAADKCYLNSWSILAQVKIGNGG